MQCNIAGNALVFTSEIKLEDVKLLSKANPNALILFDDEKEPVFAIGVGNFESGSIGKLGVTIDSTSRNENGFATVTGIIPEGIADAKEFAANILMPAYLSIKALEDTVPVAAEEIRAAKAALISGISVL